MGGAWKRGRRAGPCVDGHAAAGRRCGVSRGGADRLGSHGNIGAPVRCRARADLRGGTQRATARRRAAPSRRPIRCRYESALFERLVPLALCQRLERGCAHLSKWMDAQPVLSWVGVQAEALPVLADTSVGSSEEETHSLLWEACRAVASSCGPDKPDPTPRRVHLPPPLTGAAVPLRGGGRCRVPRRARSAG